MTRGGYSRFRGYELFDESLQNLSSSEELERVVYGDAEQYVLNDIRSKPFHDFMSYMFPSLRIHAGGNYDKAMQELIDRMPVLGGLFDLYRRTGRTLPGASSQRFDVIDEVVAVEPHCCHDVWYIHVPKKSDDEGEEGLLDPESEAEVYNELTERLKTVASEIYPEDPNNGNGKKIWPSRYEIWNPFQESEFKVQVPEELDGAEVCGFFDFLCGPICSMESVLIAGEVTGNLDDLGIDKGEKLIPPLVDEFTKERDDDPPNLIFLKYGNHYMHDRAEKWPGQGEDNPEDWSSEFDPWPHRFVRCYHQREDQFPTPGEMLCLVCRAFRMAQVWWFQEKNPFLYSGHWFETTFYTSGIIKEKNEVEGSDPTDYTYKVRWHDDLPDAEVKSTDYFEYEVDERVAIMKDVGSNEATMNWKKLTEELGTFEEGWRIAPLSFYEEE